MYIYLEKNRNSYHKGQLTPFFIAILTILIIAIMVTVNIGKVSQIKTHASNSADAGALAAGSAMASIFNSLAVSNQQLVDSNATFHLYMDGFFAEAYDNFDKSWQYSLAAMALATSNLGIMYLSACAAIVVEIIALVMLALAWWHLNKFKTIIQVIQAYVESQYAAMLEAYQNIRTSITEAIPDAITAGHQLVFANSNISAKLIDDSEKISEGGWNKTRDDYQDFVDDLGSGTTYTFSWQDGHGRSHSVTSNVSTADVVNYDLRHTKWDSDKLDDTFDLIQDLSDVALILYGLAFTQYLKPINPLPMNVSIGVAARDPSQIFSLSNYDVTAIYGSGDSDMNGVYDDLLDLDEPPDDPQAWMGNEQNENTEDQDTQGIFLYSCAVEVVATAIAGIGRVVWHLAWDPEAWEMAGETILWGIIWNAIGLALMPFIKILTDDAYDGLRCIKSFTSSSTADVGDRLICFIEEVEHDRKATVSSTQAHEGQNLTLWQTEYPDITSRAVTDFRGGGNIYLPSWSHSAVLEEAN